MWFLYWTMIEEVSIYQSFYILTEITKSIQVGNLWLSLKLNFRSLDKNRWCLACRDANWSGSGIRVPLGYVINEVFVFLSSVFDRSSIHERDYIHWPFIFKVHLAFHGCNHWLFEFLMLFYGLWLICPFWPLKPDINMALFFITTSTCLNALTCCHVIGW